METKSVAAALALALAAAPCVAADTAQSVNIIFTAENASCAAWTKSAGNKSLRAHYEFWARGFVSGHNYANLARQVKVGAFPSDDELYQYFDNYCRDNPQHTFVEATIHLVTQLREPSAPAKAPAGKPVPAKPTPPAR